MATIFGELAMCSEPGGFEALEARALLAAAPIITEFVASNKEVLTDGDRDSSDWIEVYNQGDESLDLQGWHLTDDRDNLSKWAFPSVVLDPGEFLVVFASSKDTTDRRGNLHTNFSLSKGGEYLGLVHPDGTTIASQFGTGYPAQFTDIAYGLPMENTPRSLIDGSSSAQVLVPTDNQLGTEWTRLAFDPNDSWLVNDVLASIGFANEDSPLSAEFATDLGDRMPGISSSAYIRIPFQIPSTTHLESLKLDLKYDDGFARLPKRTTRDV